MNPPPPQSQYNVLLRKDGRNKKLLLERINYRPDTFPDRKTCTCVAQLMHSCSYRQDRLHGRQNSGLLINAHRLHKGHFSYSETPFVQYSALLITGTCLTPSILGVAIIYFLFPFLHVFFSLLHLLFEVK